MKLRWFFLLFGALLIFTKMAFAKEDIDVGYYYLNQDPDYFYFTPKVGYSTTIDNWDVFPSSSFNMSSHFSRAVLLGGVDFGYRFRGMPFSLEVSYDYLGDRKYTWKPMFVNEPSSSAEYAMHSQAVCFSGRYDYQGFESFNPYFSFGMGAGIHNGKFTFPDPYDMARVNEVTNNEHGLLFKVVLGGAIKMSNRISWIFEANYFYWPGTKIVYTVGNISPVTSEFARAKHFHTVAITTGLSFGF